MDERKLINQGISYEIIKNMQEHARQYDFVSDKKAFLKSVSPYEQKIILLSSNKPYEVLTYLDELDIKATRKLLKELTYDEIKKIISLFSSEDKKNFYTYYSDLSLVNQFIVYDKNSLEYIDDLTFRRKVELIDSSNSKTVEATSKVYQTMSEEQQEIVSDFVTESSAVSALSEAEDQVDSVSSNDQSLEQQENQIFEQIIEEQLDDNIEQTDNVKPEEQESLKIKSEISENNPDLNKIKSQEYPEDFTSSNQEIDLETIELFTKAKQDCEIRIINQLSNQLHKDVIDYNKEPSKSL